MELAPFQRHPYNQHDRIAPKLSPRVVPLMPPVPIPIQPRYEVKASLYSNGAPIRPQQTSRDEQWQHRKRHCIHIPEVRRGVGKRGGEGEEGSERGRRGEELGRKRKRVWGTVGGGKLIEQEEKWKKEGWTDANDLKMRWSQGLNFLWPEHFPAENFRRNKIRIGSIFFPFISRS